MDTKAFINIYTFIYTVIRIGNEFVNASLAGDVSRMVRLRCQVSVDCRNRKWGFTALMASAGNGHLHAVRYLVTCGANLNIQDPIGWTALMLAARSNHLDVVEFLVQCGADTKRKNRLNQSVYGFGNRREVAAAVERGLKQRLSIIQARKASNTIYKPVIDWNEDDVVNWLKKKGMGQYEKVFRDNLINGDMLLDIDADDLNELECFQQLSPEDRQRLSMEIASVRYGVYPNN